MSAYSQELITKRTKKSYRPESRLRDRKTVKGH